MIACTPKRSRPGSPCCGSSNTLSSSAGLTTRWVLARRSGPGSAPCCPEHTRPRRTGTGSRAQREIPRRGTGTRARAAVRVGTVIAGERLLARLSVHDRTRRAGSGKSSSGALKSDSRLSYRIVVFVLVLRARRHSARALQQQRADEQHDRAAARRRATAAVSSWRRCAPSRLAEQPDRNRPEEARRRSPRRATTPWPARRIGRRSAARPAPRRACGRFAPRCDRRDRFAARRGRRG